MGGVRMCADCRRRKVKCESLNKDKPERTWVEGGLQEKCAKCEKYGHKCGPPQYPSEQSPLEPGNGNQLRRRVSAVAPSLEQQHSVISPVDRSVPGTRLSGELEEDKLELQRKLGKIDSRVEASKIMHQHLEQPLDAAVFSDYTTLLAGNIQEILSLLRLAIPLTDALEAAGEADTAENAYIQMLTVYRAVESNSWYEVKGLLRRLASISWKTGRHQRGQNFAWEALQCRDSPPRADRSDLEILKEIAKSLSRTSNDLSEIIQSTIAVNHPPQLTSHIPMLHKMMESVYASSVAGNIFWTAALPSPSDHPPPQHPIIGGIGAILEFIRELPNADLLARDSNRRSPLYMAALSGKEAFGYALMVRAKEIPGITRLILDARDHTSQTILGIAICSGCSTSFIEALIEHGVDVNPDMVGIYNPLQVASWMGSLEVVDLLVKRGAIIDKTLPDVKTALDIARDQGHHDIVQLLSSASQGSGSSTPHTPH